MGQSDRLFVDSRGNAAGFGTGTLVDSVANVGATSKTFTVPTAAFKATVVSDRAWYFHANAASPDATNRFAVAAGGSLSNIPCNEDGSIKITAQAGNLREVSVIWEI